MSTFLVTIEKIAAVWPHPNADRLEMARLESMTYQFVIAKDSYKTGDLVVYFPVDSVLPDPLIEALGLTGKLSGSARNRVKTIRLRGSISQGVVAKPQTVIPNWTPEIPLNPGQDMTELLGVTKYDPPIMSEEGGMGRMPDMVSVYDIEGVERFGDIVEKYLLDKPVIITEKVEGSHFSSSLLEKGEIEVCRRRYRITPVEGAAEHDWLRLARESGINAALPLIKAELEQSRDGEPIYVLTIRGEMIGPGIQGNHYQLKQRAVKVFEIEVNGTPIDAHTYLALVQKFALDAAPLIAVDVTFRDWLAGRSIAEASNGPSVLLPSVLREGIVIRPIAEARDEDKLGRVILKQRSPEYLVGSEF